MSHTHQPIITLTMVLFSLFIMGIGEISPKRLYPITRSDKSPHVSGLTHAPITIVGDGDFTIANGVVEGSGTPTDPYIIANWTIDGISNDSCLYIQDTTAFFKIQNCTLYNANVYPYAALELVNVTNGIIANNTISNNRFGLFVRDSYNNTISDNTCINNRNALMIYGSWNNTISGNICNNNRWGGIESSESFENIFSVNICSNNYVIGIEFLSSPDNILDGNICLNNTIWNGIQIDQSPRNNITGNNCSLNGIMGIGVINSNNNSISENTCTNNANSGICIQSSSYNDLVENICKNNAHYGITLDSAFHTKVTGNILEDNGEGCILEKGGSENDIHDNNCPTSLPDYLFWVLVIIGIATITIVVVAWISVRNKRKDILIAK